MMIPPVSLLLPMLFLDISNQVDRWGCGGILVPKVQSSLLEL
jgi:hypothetical protein